MTNAKKLVGYLLGPGSKSAYIFLNAIEVTEHAIFELNIPPEFLQVFKHVYPVVSEKLQIANIKTIARAVERAHARCLIENPESVIEKIIGKKLAVRPTPRAMLIYLAYYCHTSTPYWEACGEDACPPL